MQAKNYIADTTGEDSKYPHYGFFAGAQWLCSALALLICMGPLPPPLPLSLSLSLPRPLPLKSLRRL